MDTREEIIELEGVHPDMWLTPEGRKKAQETLSRNWDKLLRGSQPEDADETWVTLCFGSAGNGEVTLSVNEDSAPSGRGFSRHERLSSDAGCW